MNLISSSQINCRRLVATTVWLGVFAFYLFLMVSWMGNSANPKSDTRNATASSSPPVPTNIDQSHKYSAVVRRANEAVATADETTEPPISANEIESIVHRYPTSYTFLWDIFISVKTTGQFHRSRLHIILDTWYKLARNQTYFFTDADDEEYNKRAGGHLINTNCSSSHNRKALCCKMSVEFDRFLASNKKWFCHFDDDNYVNVPKLVKLLQRFNPLDDWYLGKPSIRQALEITDRESKNKISFWFATGGAGFCISKSLAQKMAPIASDGRLVSIGEKIRLPDDVTVGYIIEHMLQQRLTVVEEFHSHLESMALIGSNTLEQQVSLSYSDNPANPNRLLLKRIAAKPNDHSSFYSLHCYLYPNMCRFR